ncbi:MFS transporter [Desulforamulus ruminis]|uniref:Major facilitator superfamily MFS_1 n=1 Tax=Desulforamulus ruminis (strain ATCC 23193 / DSM 2154 / NCIMB 8452 / DL) TaxID=696281 RepID=F6DKV8_DESRL|nr:MFS transporter [Desulforamulus ruminis]AEG61590.1 major facilitator superfamily MFS_1 [Desulforamulus ruminis DSM 2154]
MDHEASLKKYTLLVATTASFLTPFMGSAINLAVPAIGKEFNSSALLLSWVVTSFLLASAAFLVPFGRLADIVGRKKVFITGITIFSLASIFCGMAGSVEALIAFRVLQGVGSAMIFGTGMAILTSVFPPQERGKVLGINGATVYVGLSLGPVLGGFMNHQFGWHSIFYLNAVLGILAALLAFYKLTGEWAGASGEKYDWVGALLYILGLVTFMYGVSATATSALAKYLLAVGFMLLILFIRYEMKVTYPVLNLKLFSRNITFAFSNLAALINYSATFALGFLLSVYLQVVMGYDSQQAGLILLAQPVLMALLSPFAGRLSDRVEPRIVSSWGMALTTLGLGVFSFLSGGTPLWLIIINLALLGTGFALFSSPNSNAVMGSVEKKYYGIASSTLGTMRLTGQAISMAIVTLIINLFVGNVELNTADAALLLKGTRTAFMVFAIVCLGGVFASLARGNVKASLGMGPEDKQADRQ